MPGYNPDNYTTVAERLALAGDNIQTIIAEPPQFMTEAMGYIRVTVALKDGRSSTGMASFRLDLQGRSAQATNPIEDCETSAVGRALGMLGYGSKQGIASREEVQEAHRRQGRTEYIPVQDVPEPPSGGEPVPTCPEHNKLMKPGKDGKSFYCPVKHGDKWYTVKAEPRSSAVVEDLL